MENHIFYIGVIVVSSVALTIYGRGKFSTFCVLLIAAWSIYTELAAVNTHLMFYVWVFFALLSLADVLQSQQIRKLTNDEKKADQSPVDPATLHRAINEFANQERNE